MSKDSYLARRATLHNLGYASTATWAADLYQDFGKDGKGSGSATAGDLASSLNDVDCSAVENETDFEELVKKSDRFPLYCMKKLLPALGKVLDGYRARFDGLYNELNGKYGNYEDFVRMTTESLVDTTMWQGAAVKDVGIGFGPAFKCKLTHIYSL
jgi:hypothetical protein